MNNNRNAKGANAKCANANVNMENNGKSNGVNVNMGNNGNSVNSYMENSNNGLLHYRAPIKENRNAENKRFLKFENVVNVNEFAVPNGSFSYHQGPKNSSAKKFLAKPNVYKQTYSKIVSNNQKKLNAKHNANPNLIYKTLNQNIVETVGAIAGNHESLPTMLGNNRVRVGLNNLNRPGNSNNTRRRKSNVRNRKTKIANILRRNYKNF
jgi:hypothetical protein